MQLQIKDFPRVVIDQDLGTFNVAADGLYAIAITARCKNWLQNFRRIFNDDDLAIQIDDNLFGEIIGKKREFDGPGTWNGNEIKNFNKTVVFVLPLIAGEHSLRFFADGQPWIEKINIAELEFESGSIDLGKFFLPAASAGVLFFDVVTKDHGFNGVKIKAHANYGDKLQLKINGQIVENNDSVRYKIWYWLGDKLKGSPREMNVEYGDNNLAHALEFKGAGKPVIENIAVSIKEININKRATVALYEDITLFDFVYLRSEASDSAGTDLARLKNGDRVEILEELEKYQGQTKNLVSCVLKNSQQKQWHTIWWPKPLLVFVFGFSFIMSAFAYHADYADSAVEAVHQRYNSLGRKRPASELKILWKYGSDQLLFYSPVQESIFRLSASQLLIDNDPGIFTDEQPRLVDVQGAILDSQGQIYFLAALQSCGQNCDYTLFRLNTNADNLTIVKKDLLGGEIKLYLSDDNQHLAIVSSFEGGVCNIGANINILDTASFVSRPINGFDWPGSTAAFVMSAEWKNNNDLLFSLTQGKCAGSQRGNRDSKYSYGLSEKKLRLLKESFRPESDG